MSGGHTGHTAALIDRCDSRIIAAPEDRFAADRGGNRLRLKRLFLADIEVSFNGVTWVSGVNYSYDETSGSFATLPGQITVPAASYTRNADGSVLTVPGTALLEIKGALKQQS